MNNVKTLAQTQLEVLTENKAIEKIIADEMGRAIFLEAANALFKSPAYANCTVESVLGCLLKAAIFGFRLSPELGEAWAIPRKVKTGRKIQSNGKEVDEYEYVCQFQIGYKGWQKLASATGRVSFWDYATVWENDKFDYELGSGQYIKHTPTLDAMKRGKRIAFWAKAKLTDGNEVFHIITADEAEQYRRFSETQYDWIQGGGKQFVGPKGIWAANYDAMALRMPIREIATKKIPRTELISQAIEADDSVTRINMETGEAVTQGKKEVEEITPHEVVLHDDYKDEIEACKTKEQVREIFDRRVKEMDSETQKLYVEFCTAHTKKILNDGRA